MDKKTKMTSALQIRVQTSLLGARPLLSRFINDDVMMRDISRQASKNKDYEELHKKAMEEVNCDGDFVGMKQVVVGKTIKEDEQKREGSISTEEKGLAPINNIPEYDDDDDDEYDDDDDDDDDDSSVDADDLTSADDADSTSGYNDEADDEDYISDDDGLINNNADGLADFDEFRRNIPSDVYDTDSDYEEGEDVIMTPYFAITRTSASTQVF